MRKCPKYNWYATHQSSRIWLQEITSVCTAVLILKHHFLNFFTIVFFHSFFGLYTFVGATAWNTWKLSEYASNRMNEHCCEWVIRNSQHGMVNGMSSAVSCQFLTVLTFNFLFFNLQLSNCRLSSLDSKFPSFNYLLFIVQSQLPPLN